MSNSAGIKKGMVTVLFSLASTLLFAQNTISSPKQGNVYVIAHRGAHSGIPENSLAAYQKAIDLGCDFIEIDVRTTSDGEIVSIHNATIDAYVLQKKGKVSDLTLQEIRDLDIGEKVGPEWKGTQVPTFEEILELSAGKIGIYLDLKEADPQVLIPLLRKYDMAQTTVWYVDAAQRELIQSIQGECPECLVMPDPSAEAQISKVVEMYQPKILATDMGQLTPGFVKEAHRLRSMVFVDDRVANVQEWKQILSFGTDGIQTDQPEALIRYLQSLP